MEIEASVKNDIYTVDDWCKTCDMMLNLEGDALREIKSKSSILHDKLFRFPFITFKPILFFQEKEIKNTPILTSNTVVIFRVDCYSIF